MSRALGEAAGRVQWELFMTTFATALRSSLGKKYLMGFTGLVWVGFTVGHLIGNLLLFAGREPFNAYAYFLESLGHGMAIYVAEAALIATLAIHVINGIQVALADKSAARPVGYAMSGNAGGRSRKSLASKNMIWTGSLILAFLVLHIATFKFAHLWGPVEQFKLHDGTQVKDLYGVVVERFSYGPYVLIYTVAMAMLGLHLSHGIWSAFQSLGLLTRRTFPLAVSLGTVVAALLTVGFLMLPLTIFVLNQTFQNGPGGLHL
jgi:succinate dehydrogenase / fumarate reductase cytochrome b subunit